MQVKAPFRGLIAKQNQSPMEDVADREPLLKMKRLYKKGSSGEFHLIDLILGLLVLAALAYALIVYGIPWVKNLGNQGNELSDKNAEYSSEFLNDNNGDTPTESDIDDGSADTGDADPTRPAEQAGIGEFADFAQTFTSSSCIPLGRRSDLHLGNTQCWTSNNDPLLFQVKFSDFGGGCLYRFKACWYDKSSGESQGCKSYFTDHDGTNHQTTVTSPIRHITNYNLFCDNNDVNLRLDSN